MKEDKVKKASSGKEYKVSVSYGGKSLEQCMRRVIQSVIKRGYKN